MSADKGPSARQAQVPSTSLVLVLRAVGGVHHPVSWKALQGGDHLLVAVLVKIAVEVANRAKFLRRIQADDRVDFGVQLLDRIKRRHGHRQHQLLRLPFANCSDRSKNGPSSTTITTSPFTSARALS